MAHAEVPQYHNPHNPLERLGHRVREIPAWAGRHWKSLALTLAALGGAGYASYLLARPYTPDTQVKTTIPVSDTFNRPDSGLGVIIPVTPTEIPPTATAPPSPEPTAAPTVNPTETATPAPLKEKPTSLTAENFSEFVTTVSQEEFQKLTQAQPDAFAFPVESISGKMVTSIYLQEQLAQPIVINKPGHITTIKAYVTDLTPSPFGEGWISQDGKAVIPQTD